MALSKRAWRLRIVPAHAFWFVTMVIATAPPSGDSLTVLLLKIVPHGAPIPLETTTITFEDILRFNDSSHEFWRDFASRAAEPYLPYFGAPSTLIDAAWSQLLLGEFPGVSDEEIATNPGLQRTFVENDRNPRTGHFHIGLDVLHSLHCLNEVRKALDEEHCSPRSSSPASGSGIWAQRSQQRMHIDHCLNHIRQSLQCRPDLAPAAMKKHVTTDGEEFYLGNAEEHSCYDWSKIRSWLDTRRESELGAWENS